MNAPSSSRSLSQSGFTLVELLVVLTILSLVTVVLAAQWGRPRDRLTTEILVGQLVASLKATRAIAVSSNTDASIAISATSNEIVPPKPLTPLRFPSTVSIAMVVAARRHQPTGVGIVTFFPDGSSTGATIRITQATSVSLVIVDWLTGRADVHRER